MLGLIRLATTVIPAATRVKQIPKFLSNRAIFRFSMDKTPLIGYFLIGITPHRYCVEPAVFRHPRKLP